MAALEPYNIRVPSTQFWPVCMREGGPVTALHAPQQSGKKGVAVGADPLAHTAWPAAATLLASTHLLRGRRDAEGRTGDAEEVVGRALPGGRACALQRLDELLEGGGRPGLQATILGRRMGARASRVYEGGEPSMPSVLKRFPSGRGSPHTTRKIVPSQTAGAHLGGGEPVQVGDGSDVDDDVLVGPVLVDAVARVACHQPHALALHAHAGYSEGQDMQ